MHTGSSRFWIWCLTGILTIFVVVFLNFVFARWKAQADLTEDKRYTLPEEAKTIAASLEDVCKITVYLSDPLPSYLRFVPRVIQTRLEEFRKASNGKIEYTFIAPDTDKNLMDELAKRTPPIQPVGLQDVVEGKSVSGAYYFWMVFRYGDEEAPYNLLELRQAILQEGELLKQLPFQIAAKLVKLKNPNMKVGIASEKKALPREMQPQQGQQNEPTDGLSMLRESIARHLPKAEDVALKGGIPVRDDVQTLIVYRPESLDERAVFELDQFLMKGKRVVVLLDNVALFDIDRIPDYQAWLTAVQGAARGGGDFSSLKVREIQSGLKDWLAHYGVRVEDGYLEDASNAKSIRSSMQFVDAGNGKVTLKPVTQTMELPGFVLVNEFGEDKKSTHQFSESSPALAGLGRVVMQFPVPMSVDRDAVGKHGTDAEGKARVTLEEQLRSSREAWVRKPADGKVKLFYPPDAAPPEKGEWGSHPLVVSMHGNFKSYFADKSYGDADRPPRKGPDGKDQPEGPSPPAKLTESTAPGQLWVFADADFVSDFSYQTQAFQVPVAGVLSSQQAMQAMQLGMVGLVNVLDSITVGDELIEIRRPNIVDRSVDATRIDEDKGTIKFKTVGLAPLVLVAFGLLRWIVRALTTRAQSPSGRARKPQAHGGGDALRQAAPEPPATVGGGTGGEVRS